jgi:hypothetical protein
MKQIQKERMIIELWEDYMKKAKKTKFTDNDKFIFAMKIQQENSHLISTKGNKDNYIYSVHRNY